MTVSDACMPWTDAVPWLRKALFQGHMRDGGAISAGENNVSDLLLIYLTPPPVSRRVLELSTLVMVALCGDLMESLKFLVVPLVNLLKVLVP